MIDDRSLFNNNNAVDYERSTSRGIDKSMTTHHIRVVGDYYFIVTGFLISPQLGGRWLYLMAEVYSNNRGNYRGQRSVLIVVSPVPK